jgi:mannitol 2-dehydrogenase
MTAQPLTPLAPLNDWQMGDLPAAVAEPGYDRNALTPAVVHIGVGGFHRAHQAVYFDDLARNGVTEWGLTGVGLRCPSMGEVLSAQDRLYLVVERHPTRERVRVVGVMGRYLFAPHDPDAVLGVLSDERTRLVTLTITDAGYPIDLRSGQFHPDDDLVSEVGAACAPTSTFGYLVEALARRRRNGIAPFTVLCCDNLPDNGRATRTAVVSCARLRDPSLADWIEQQVAFPSSMVDRITPQTTAEDRDDICARHQVRDRWPVITEPFRQWVIEDSFCNGRPPLEMVGARFVPDVAPYAQMKTRLLNAAHCAIGFLGYFGGYRTTGEVMSDPVFVQYLAGMMAEVVPTLDTVPDMDLESYQRSLVERLGNPQMSDQLARLRRRGATKIANQVVPSLAMARATDRPHGLLSLAVAAWLRFPAGQDYAEAGLQLERQRVRLVSGHEPARDVEQALKDRAVFGNLVDDARFTASVKAQLAALDEHGVRRSITRCLHRSSGVGR